MNTSIRIKSLKETSKSSSAKSLLPDETDEVASSASETAVFNELSLYCVLLRALLLFTAFLTMIDSIYLIISKHSVFMLAMCLLRLVATTLAFIFTYVHGTKSAHMAAYVGVQIIYMVFTTVMLFLMGLPLPYQSHIWSLILQIIHHYICIIYSFKMFVYFYDFKHMKGATAQRSLPSKRLQILQLLDANLLAVATLYAIGLAAAVAILLRRTSPDPWTARQLMYLKFFGEIFIRILISLAGVLIWSSIAFACASFDTSKSSKVLLSILCYYLATTTLATFVGIGIVSFVQPGSRVNITANQTTTDQKMTKLTKSTMIMDTLLDMARNMFTDNLFRAWLSTQQTFLITPDNLLNLTRSEVDKLGNRESWKIKERLVPGANIMSLVLLGVTIGVMANSMKKEGEVLVSIINAMNTIVMKITNFIVEIAPLGTVFLMLPQILVVEDIGKMFQMVGWFTLTVFLSLSVHCFVVIALIYFLFTKKNPYRFLVKMLPAISTAFGTSSSNATIAATIYCLEKRVKLNRIVTRFCIPLGASINMDGGALYEGVAAIFVAQYRKKPLGISDLVTISLTSVLVSVGAAGIPQAGMITTITVLSAVGLNPEDAALVVVVDFFLDRFRTVVNVLGDAYGTAIVDHRIKLPKIRSPQKTPASVSKQ